MGCVDSTLALGAFRRTCICSNSVPPGVQKDPTIRPPTFAKAPCTRTTKCLTDFVSEADVEATAAPTCATADHKRRSCTGFEPWRSSSGWRCEERGQDKQHAERPRDVGEDGRQYAARGSTLQRHDGSEDGSREDQYGIATGNGCQDIENRGYQHSVSHADGGKECTPENSSSAAPLTSVITRMIQRFPNLA